MKLHLPITLLAVMLSSVVYAGGTYRPAVIVSVEAGTSITSDDINPTTEKTIIDELAAAAYTTDNSAPLTYTKDGLGTLTVDSDVTMVNPLFVREGTLEIKNATVTSNVALDSGVSNLIVAGKSAVLKLENAHYSQTVSAANGNNYGSSITIGSDDGAGAVYLTSKSTLHTDHCLFIGRTNTTYEGGPAYVQPSYAATSGDTLYTDGDKKASYISIGEGCEMSAGTQIFLDNVTVDIAGDNARMVAGTRSINEPDINIKVSRLGTQDGVKTTVNVSNGGLLSFLSGMYTGVANAEVTVNVTGSGSSLNIEGKNSFLGLGTYDYSIGDYVANDSTTQISITEGASMNVETEVIVGYSSAAGITVDEESSITASEASTDALLTIMGQGTLENSGTVGIATVVDGGELTLNGGIMADVTLKSGDIYVNGATSTGALTLTGGTITFDLNPQVATFAARTTTPATALTVDSLSVENTTIVVNLSEEDFNNLEGSTFSLFDVKDGEATDLSQAEVVFTDGTQTKTATITSGTDGSFTVTSTQLVPEPTTATLSLLALAALAARRRRK